jgi:hypothetical protein
VNRNAIPTIIRGTSLVPGAQVAVLLTPQNPFDRPRLEWHPIIATNGTTFAHVRGTWRKRDRGPFAYVEQPHAYLVSQAEADAALVDALGPQWVERVDAERADVAERLADLARIDAKLIKLRNRLEFCGACNPHRPMIAKYICARCERRACEGHVKHDCIAKEQSA